MKKLIVIAVLAALLVSCEKDSDVPVASEEMAEYTIIYYANGGRNLDLDSHKNLQQLYEGLRQHSQVKAVAQFKNSTDADEDMLKSLSKEGFDFVKGATYRFVMDVDASQGVQMQFTNENMLEGNVDITRADSLASYIRYAAKACPARHYVLILGDHGGGYLPHQDRSDTFTTRGLLFDDGHDNVCLSVCALAQAIHASGVPIDALYLDACLMNDMEIMYELQPVVKYVVAATLLTPNVGGQYTRLVERLTQSSSVEDALRGYLDDVYVHWKTSEEAGIYPGDYEQSDIALTNTDLLVQSGPAIRQFVDELLKAYGDGSVAPLIDSVTAKVKANDNYQSPFYDFVDFLDGFSASHFPAALREASSQAKDAVVKGKLYARGTAHVERRGLPTYSFLLGNSGGYSINVEDSSCTVVTNRFDWDGTYTWRDMSTGETIVRSWQGGDATYKNLRFEQATGMSRWLKANRQTPMKAKSEE